MKRPVRKIILLLTIGLLDACSILQVTPNLVTPSDMSAGPSKERIGPLQLNRKIPDHTCDVNEAVDLIRSCSIDVTSG